MLEIINLKKGKILNLNYSLYTGSICIIFGSNKNDTNMLLQILAGIEPYEVGKIKIKGKAITNDTSKYVQNNNSILINNYKLPKYKKVSDILNRIDCDSKEEKERILTSLNINHLSNKLIHEISERQKRILSLIDIFFTQANLILLDNPTRNLDQLSRDIIILHLKYLCDFGKIIVLTTDNFNLTKQFSNIINLDKNLKYCDYD